ncbi:purine-nucleoside phosphorylase [Companilactobacillus metriopterae]|uniref:purine-nucleoside phosphorylase n=1 Tax=Companilactobacillus metriopterae TaxID=1909267 RepID=UPI00100B8227|nr:purine-nucleoside phosphorylase [Companilactobacillus metriopterae]
MSTHIDAKPGDIAEVVLMPGDPLRAKFIAENFLEDIVLYNTVRNAFGYTGTYKGKRVSVQASGMGIPSISIYANELVKFYGVKKLIRVGTIGAIGKDVKVRDVIIADSASTDSSFIHNIFGRSIYYAPTADFEMVYDAYQIAKNMGVKTHVGNILSADRFYNDEIDNEMLSEYGVLGIEMEAAALYTIAVKHDAKAVAICTVSDEILNGVSTSSKEREQSFKDMMIISLETAIK